VTEVVRTEKPGLVWDLGCNEGHHARIAGRDGLATSSRWISTRSSSSSIRRPGQRGPGQDPTADHEPRRSLAGARLERARAKPLPDRGSPDLALCLALIHHVSITGNIPVAEFLELAAEHEDVAGDRVPDTG